MVRWVATLALVLLAVACGKVATPEAAPPAPEPVWVDPTCPPASTFEPIASSVARGAVPDDFATAWVLRCRTDTRTMPGKGVWLVAVAERADTSAADLIALLRQPSEPLTAGACPAIAVLVPYFALVNAAGKAILPAVPGDACGQPRRDALTAIDALSFRTLSETPQGQVQSQGSVDSGCAESWKDLIAIETGAQPAPARALWSTPPPSTLRVCRYTQATEPMVGQLSTTRTLTGAPAASLLATLDRAGPAGTCSTPHTTFAVLTAENGGNWAVAELDGCHRLLRPDHTLGQLDAATVAALLA